MIKYLFFVLFPLSVLAQQAMIVFDGNSLTFGTGSSDPPTKSTSAQASLSPADVINVGIAGEKLATNTGDRVATEFLAADVGAKLTIVFREGINDIAINDSASNINGYIDTYITAMRASNATVKILGCTLTDYVGMGETFQSRVDTVNTHILTTADFDYTVDLASDTRLDDPSDATYYSDTTHHTDAGYLVCAQLIEAVLIANTRLSAEWYQAYDPTTSGLKIQ